MQSDIPGLDFSAMTLPHVPTNTANNSGTYGVPGQYGSTPPASGQQGLPDGVPTSAREASQYETSMAASLSASGEPPSSGDEGGMSEIE